MALLSVQNLTFTYAAAATPAVQNVSFDVKDGECMLLCGQSGCGKTTLLRLLKREIAPVGRENGSIMYDDVCINNGKQIAGAAQIGFVGQNPDNQIVTDTVWSELAFGLENLGVQPHEMHRRVAEIAQYFGITDWLYKKTDSLSGGQKQLLNLAAVMVMQPKLLILDEPTAQLDPIAATAFLTTLHRLHQDNGLTILLTEHRLEEVFPIADTVMVMDAGNIAVCTAPAQVGVQLRALDTHHFMLDALPTPMRVFDALDLDTVCPLTVRDGRDFLLRHFAGGSEDLPTAPDLQEMVMSIHNAWFRYERDLPDVLRGVNLAVHKGEWFCLLGGNGSGKTTTLQLLAGLHTPYRGTVKIFDKKIEKYTHNTLYQGVLSLLPQNPQTVFSQDTVRADLMENAQSTAMLDSVCERVGITHLFDRHPYDLSGGEMQKCALAKLLLSSPKIILLDEPTKGLDTTSKQELATLLLSLKAEGITIVTVTHDVEFAAMYADRCALFFDGQIGAAEPTKSFFANNMFYTTAAHRMAKDLWRYAVTADDVIARAWEELT